MSSSDAVALYQHTHPKLAYYLTTAIVGGLLAIPTGMLVTSLLATKTVPTTTVSAASQQTEGVPSQSALDKSTTRDVAPSAALPSEGVGGDGAPSIGAPTTIVPAATAAAATISPPASTGAVPPEADRIAGLAVAPGAAGTADISHPRALRTDRAHATAHAAVLALAKILTNRRGGTQHARRAVKEVARNESGSRPIGSPQQPVGTATMQQAAGALDRRGGRPGILGGAATDSASSAGLNGTGMRHRL